MWRATESLSTRPLSRTIAYCRRNFKSITTRQRSPVVVGELWFLGIIDSELYRIYFSRIDPQQRKAEESDYRDAMQLPPPETKQVSVTNNFLATLFGMFAICHPRRIQHRSALHYLLTQCNAM